MFNIDCKYSFWPIIITARIFIQILFRFVVAIQLPFEFVFAESANHVWTPWVFNYVSSAFWAWLMVELVKIFLQQLFVLGVRYRTWLLFSMIFSFTFSASWLCTFRTVKLLYEFVFFTFLNLIQIKYTNTIWVEAKCKFWIFQNLLSDSKLLKLCVEVIVY